MPAPRKATRPPRKPPPPDAVNAYWLAAAGEWLQAPTSTPPRAAIAKLAPPLAAADAREQRRLDAEVALARGDTARAAEILRGLSGDDAATLATRARVQFGSLRSRTRSPASWRATSCSSGPPTGRRTSSLIVDGIQSAHACAAPTHGTPAGADPVLAGWLELGRILADAKSGALGAQRRLQAWREPLPDRIPRANRCGRASRSGRSQPASGRSRSRCCCRCRDARPPPAARSATASSAPTTTRRHGARPRVRVYDVAERDAPSAYLQALADGCDFVVGPLTREEVAALATLADGRATTLALNFLPDSVQVPDRFYQFALSPEDEARLAARRIAADGRAVRRHARAAVRLGPPRRGRFRRGVRGRGRPGRGTGGLPALHGGLQRDHSAACCARPASAAAARGPTRSSSSSPRSRCTGG